MTESAFRVLIVNPPAYRGVDYIREGRCMQSRDSWTALWPPLTLMYLSAILRTRVETRLVDCVAARIDFEGLMRICSQLAPEAVVINTAFPTISWDLSLAERCKSLPRPPVTLAVGMYPTLLAQETLQEFPALDYAIVGEPENAVRDLITALSGGGMSEMPSVAYRKAGEIVVPKERAYVENLDELPFPDRESLPPDLYRFPLDGKPFTLVSFARGCPHRCTFCAAPLYHGNRWRRRSAESVADEIEVCVRRHGIRNFLLWGESISFEREFILDLCRRIKSKKVDISWVCASRADSLDSEIIKEMKAAGCFMTSLGIESASQEILDRSRKGITIEKIEEACSLCRAHGLKVMGHFIFGLPGETVRTALSSIAFAKRHVDFAQFYCAVPYPGT
jgi:radical SAM superfamily enzyme YgiQ (UPF0313 family)